MGESPTPLCGYTTVAEEDQVCFRISVLRFRFSFSVSKISLIVLGISVGLLTSTGAYASHPLFHPRALCPLIVV